MGFCPMTDLDYSFVLAVTTKLVETGHLNGLDGAVLTMDNVVFNDSIDSVCGGHFSDINRVGTVGKRIYFSDLVSNHENFTVVD